MSKLVPMACALALLAAAGSTSASTGPQLTISGSGQWAGSGNVPTTDYSAPNATFSFSFQVPTNFDPITTGGEPDITGVGFGEVSNFVYKLNGTKVTAGTLASIYFPDAAAGGGLDLNFYNAGNPSDPSDPANHSVFLYGPALVGSPAAPPLIQGAFKGGGLYPNIDGCNTATTAATCSLDPAGSLNEGGATPMTFTSGIPEPSAWALMLLGVGLGGATLRGRRRRAAA